MAEVDGSGIGSLQVTQNDVLSHGVDLFEATRQEKSVLGGKEISYRPVSGWSSEGPFLFRLPSQAGNYVQLGSFRLYGKTRIVLANGDAVAAGTNVGPVNMFPASLFKSVEVELNGNNVSDLGSAAAHYKTYIESLMTYGVDARNGHLNAAMFRMDVAGNFDSVNGGVNTGYRDRRRRTEDSKVFDWEIPLNADFLRADRFLPPQNEINIKLTRSNDAFSLMTTTPAAGAVRPAYKVEIIDLRLYVRMLQLHPGVEAYHVKGWQKQPLIYPINKTVISNWNVPQQSSHANIGPIFGSNLPKSIVVGMVRSSAFNGSLYQNPFKFEHFHLNSMQLQVKGVGVPTEPYRPDFANGLFAREYNGLFQQSGIKHSNEGNCITRELFEGGAYLQAFDLTSDNCNGFHQHPSDEGSLTLELGFSQPLDDPITVLIYSVFDAEVRVNQNREAVSSYILSR